MVMIKKVFEFFPTPRFLKFSYVGLDISREFVHYAELISTGESFKLGRYGRRVFEAGDNMLTNDSLKNTLKEIKKTDKVTYVKVALPEEETYLFTLEVTGDTSHEIKSNIEFHLEENVPIVGSEALFDYYILPKTDKKIAVVSVVSRDVVNRYSSLLEECGMVAVSFMVESGALSRSIVKKNYVGTHLLVYLSREKTVLGVVEHGFVQFSSTTSFGGAQLTSAIQKQFGVGVEEARKIKYKEGLFKTSGEDESISFGLASTISVLRDEIQRVSAYWLKQTQGGGSPVEKIILCGKDAAIPGFADYLSSSLKLPVEISNVWNNISYYNEVVPEISFEDSLSYATALGLVLSTTI
jgi:type IV pilus assembly protein PilM